MNVAEVDHNELLRRAADPATPAGELARLYADAERRATEAFHAAAEVLEAVEDTRSRLAVEEDAKEAWRREEDVRRAVAANPNTPPPTLADAAVAYPEEFCRNPVAPLVALEDPAFVRLLLIDGDDGLLRLLRREDAPESLLRALLAFGCPADVAEEVRLHVAVAGEAPDDGWQEEVWEWMSAAASELEGERRADLRALIAQGEAPPGLLAPGERPEGTAERAASVVGHALTWRLRTPPVFQLLAAASDRHGPGDLLVLLLNKTHPVWARRLGVALNPNASAVGPGALLRLLSEDGNRFVRAAARARLRQTEGSLLW